MPAVAGAAFAALGVAILCLLVAYALTVLVTPLIEAVLKQVPLIGGDLAGYARSGGDWFADKLIAWVNSSIGLATHWFNGLAEVWHDFVAQVDAFAVDVASIVDHLVTVVVPRLVHEGTALLRGEVAQQQTFIDSLPDGIADVFTKPLSDFKGIEHGVDQAIDGAIATVKNVDLPNVLTDAERAAAGLVDQAEQKLVDLRDVVDADFRAVWDKINGIPLQDLLALLVAVPALAQLVHVIEAEAGLDTPECRSKVKQICATNPAAWADLLALAGVLFAWPGLRSMVDVSRDFLGELVPAVREVVGDGG